MVTRDSVLDSDVEMEGVDVTEAEEDAIDCMVPGSYAYSARRMNEKRKTVVLVGNVGGGKSSLTEKVKARSESVASRRDVNFLKEFEFARREHEIPLGADLDFCRVDGGVWSVSLLAPNFRIGCCPLRRSMSVFLPIYPKVTKAKGLSSNADESFTRLSHAFITDDGALQIIDTPGANAMSGRLEHNVWIAHALSNPDGVHRIMLVVKADTRLDTTIGILGEYVERFQEFDGISDGFACCVLRWRSCVTSVHQFQ